MGMTALEKGAVLLLSLPRPAAEAILARIRREQGELLRADMQKLEKSPHLPALREQVLGEFDAVLQRVDAAPPNGPNQLAEVAAEQAAPKFERSSLAAERPPAPPPEPAPPPVNITAEDIAADPLGCLRRFPAERLALALRDEQPRTAVILLQHLDAKHAGDVLRQLPAELRKTLAVQLSNPAAVCREVVERIVHVALVKGLAADATPAEDDPRVRHKNMADLLRVLDKQERADILVSLEEQDAAFAAGVKDFLYQFEDLLRLENRAVQKLLGEIETRDLALALRGAPDQLRDKVLDNLSKRARELLSDEIALLSTVAPSQVESARKTITQVIQRMVERGEAELSM